MSDDVEKKPHINTPAYWKDPTLDHPMCAACHNVPWHPGQYAVIPQEHIRIRHPEILDGPLEYVSPPSTQKVMDEVVSSVVLGPEDRLILLAHPDALLPPEEMQDLVDRMGLTDRVLLIDMRGVQAIALRAARAQGSIVGECGHYPPSLLGPPPVCYLAYGHVGMHSDGTTTWTNEESQ